MKQFGAFSFIAVLLLSISGLQISFHTCGGEFRSMGIFTKAEACEHAKASKVSTAEESDCCGESNKHCKKPKASATQKKEKCCDDNVLSFEILEIELIEAQDWTVDDFPEENPKIDFQDIVVLIEEETPPRALFKPPPNSPDILVLHQVFLI